MNHTPFEWAIIGAGPAGIAAVGRLIDHGIEPASILWIDPYFNVGDLGRLWPNVSSNTTVQLFLDFLMTSTAFQYANAPIDFSLNHQPANQTCMLGHMVEPLQWITDHLVTNVRAIKGYVNHLTRLDGHWVLKGEGDGQWAARNVILTTGAEPETLHYPTIEALAFDIAIDKARLRQVIDPQQTIAVFGSSHSAIMIIRSLVELNVNKIINFYRNPCRYAINQDKWILFDNTGLKGTTADWAREFIDGTLPKNLERIRSTQPNLNQYLPLCHRAIYAVGFKRRNSITVDDYGYLDYNPHTGILARGLFGLGIAYPEHRHDPFGNLEIQVGMWKFMTYLDKIMPIWLNY